MQCEKIRRYTEPRYPTFDDLRVHPELLNHIPRRWRGNRFVLTALSLVLPLIIARQATGEDDERGQPDKLRVAPLFIHGSGRGSFGCVVVNPPVFLSEDEARQVVQDEAKKAGVDFATDSLTLKSVSVPITDKFAFLDNNDKGKSGENQPPKVNILRRDIQMDGYERKRNIAYEIVTQKDFTDWENKERANFCTVSSYDFKTTAERLGNGLARTEGDTIVAVFYEPAASSPPTATWPGKDASKKDRKAFWQERKKASKELGEKQLRQQVRDFMEWLKAQGVI